jgi:ribosomal protein L37E
MRNLLSLLYQGEAIALSAWLVLFLVHLFLLRRPLNARLVKWSAVTFFSVGCLDSALALGRLISVSLHPMAVGYWREPGAWTMLGLALLPVFIHAAGAGCMLLAGATLRKAFGARESVHPNCRRCGYNLTGNISGRCPECGAPTTGHLVQRATSDGRSEED